MIIFLFVGLKDSDKSSVLDYVENQKLHNLVCDSLDHKYMNALCQQCFMGIFCLDKRHTTQNIPGKFFCSILVLVCLFLVFVGLET